MCPRTEDNYGENSCAIICLPSTPPIVCIANCNGTIYHALLLPVSNEKCLMQVLLIILLHLSLFLICEFFQYCEDLPKNLQLPDKSLYIFESVELELGLVTTVDSKDFCCPIFLHKDPANVSSYYATHETGVHSINLLSMEDLHNFINNSDGILFYKNIPFIVGFIFFIF